MNGNEKNPDLAVTYVFTIFMIRNVKLELLGDKL